MFNPLHSCCGHQLGVQREVGVCHGNMNNKKGNLIAVANYCTTKNSSADSGNSVTRESSCSMHHQWNFLPENGERLSSAEKVLGTLFFLFCFSLPQPLFLAFLLPNPTPFYAQTFVSFMVFPDIAGNGFYIQLHGGIDSNQQFRMMSRFPLLGQIWSIAVATEILS